MEEPEARYFEVAQQSDILNIENLIVGHTPHYRLFPPFTETLISGELIAVVGRNGTGKSTLLQTLAGLLPQVSGRILVHGEQLSVMTGEAIAEKIAFVSTESIRVAGMKVADLVALGRYPHTGWFGLLSDYDCQVIRQSIEKVGIFDLTERNISELSDGERQKATIARAIAQETSILIMDEPTAFLDISAKHAIATLMRELTFSGKTIVFSTHDLNIALEQSDKIWLVSEKGVIKGAPEDLMLSDSFSELFDTVRIVHDPAGYRVEGRKSPVSALYVERHCDDKVLYFTEKALKRAGYELSSEITNPYLIISADKPAIWSIENSGISLPNSSIHSMLLCLRKLRSEA
jgi:iron complex transport system ATP-binding protein